MNTHVYTKTIIINKNYFFFTTTAKIIQSIQLKNSFNNFNKYVWDMEKNIF